MIAIMVDGQVASKLQSKMRGNSQLNALKGEAVFQKPVTPF